QAAAAREGGAARAGFLETMEDAGAARRHMRGERANHKPVMDRIADAVALEPAVAELRQRAGDLDHHDGIHLPQAPALQLLLDAPAAIFRQERQQPPGEMSRLVVEAGEELGRYAAGRCPHGHAIHIAVLGGMADDGADICPVRLRQLGHPGTGSPMPASACFSPATSSRKLQRSMISRLRRPMAALRSGEASTSRSAAARPSTSPVATMAPFSPGFTRSGPEPTLSLTTIARPAFIASFTTSPQGSCREGRTKTSAAS